MKTIYKGRKKQTYFAQKHTLMQNNLCTLSYFALASASSLLLQDTSSRQPIMCLKELKNRQKYFVLFFFFPYSSSTGESSFLFVFSFFSFSQAQSETHMTKRILVGGNEAVCTARRR